MDRPYGVVSLAVRHTKHGHDRIANVFVEHAVMLKDHVNHSREVIIEEFDGLLGAHAFRYAGKTADVRKDDGGLAADATKGLTRGSSRTFSTISRGHVAHQGYFLRAFPD